MKNAKDAAMAFVSLTNLLDCIANIQKENVVSGIEDFESAIPERRTVTIVPTEEEIAEWHRQCKEVEAHKDEVEAGQRAVMTWLDEIFDCHGPHLSTVDWRYSLPRKPREREVLEDWGSYINFVISTLANRGYVDISSSIKELYANPYSSSRKFQMMYDNVSETSFCTTLCGLLDNTLRKNDICECDDCPFSCKEACCYGIRNNLAYLCEARCYVLQDVFGASTNGEAISLVEKMIAP